MPEFIHIYCKKYCKKCDWLIIAAAALVLATGCGSPRRGEPVVGPMMSSSSQVEQGRRVFMQHCHMCHPGGEGGLGPSLNDKPLPGFAIRTQTRRGFGVMPKFDRHEIAPEELKAVVAYLSTLRQQRPGRNVE